MSSTIDTTQPAQGSALSSAVLRSEFTEAANDITALQSSVASNTTAIATLNGQVVTLNSEVAALAPAESTLPFSASIAWDGVAHPVAKVTLGGNATITFSDGIAGQSYRLAIIQDDTGNRTPTLAGVTVIGTPVWQTAAGKINIVTVDMVGSTAVATVL
jgi:hypothetical protein